MKKTQRKRARDRHAVTETMMRNVALAKQCFFVDSFEAMEIGLRESENGDLDVDDILAGPNRFDISDAVLFRIGLDVLERGVPFRALLVWLYTMRGFTLREIGKRLGISSERARQFRCVFVNVCKELYGRLEKA